MTGAFGVDGENENGERIVDFCAEREMCVFQHRVIHKYTQSALRDNRE